MAGQILLNTFLWFTIILLVCNVRSEDTCAYIQCKYRVSIDTNKCQFENFTMEQGMFSCIEACDMMPEVRKFCHLKYYLLL